MPLVWDNQSQAFVDAETPKTYNQQLEAWEDTTGNEYNNGLNAWEKVWEPLRDLIPVMSGNTCAEGSIITNMTQGGSYYGYDAWHVFDKQPYDNTVAHVVYGIGIKDLYVGFAFNSPKMVRRFGVGQMTDKNGAGEVTWNAGVFVLQASNDSIQWVDVSDVITVATNPGITETIYDTNNSSYYTYYRLMIRRSSNPSTNECGLAILNLYGR